MSCESCQPSRTPCIHEIRAKNPTWCEGNDAGKKCGECLGCVREQRDNWETSTKILTETAVDLRKDLTATLLQVSELKAELEEYRGGLRAIGIEGTATPRDTIINLFRSMEAHHQEHHATEGAVKPNPEPCGSVDTAYDQPCQMGKGHAGVHRATTVYEWAEGSEKRKEGNPA